MRLVALVTVLLLILTLNEDASALTYYGVDDGYTYGATTASGDPFDPYGSTAAHPSLPFGTVIPVCGPDACEDVTVNDRCGACDVDVTKGVAERIGLV
jgi:rare lipoprotein A